MGVVFTAPGESLGRSPSSQILKTEGVGVEDFRALALGLRDFTVCFSLQEEYCSGTFRSHDQSQVLEQTACAADLAVS